jgi:hypothetical protein
VEVDLWVGTTRLGFVGLAAVFSSLAAVYFFLGFPVSGLGVGLELVSGFVGLAVFLLAVNLECLSAYVTG